VDERVGRKKKIFAHCSSDYAVYAKHVGSEEEQLLAGERANVECEKQFIKEIVFNTTIDTYNVLHLSTQWLDWF
jgi:hypothetical protein